MATPPPAGTNNRRTLQDLLVPARSNTASAVVLPVDPNQFNFKPGVIQLMPSFHGLERENPYVHLKGFEEVCKTCFDGKTNEETVYLKLFPFSLKDKAKNWLNALPSRSINNWLELQAEFLRKFFPLHMTQGLQNQIMNFAQLPSETFAASWERYNELLLACPHHGFEVQNIISFFYQGLQPSMKLLLESMCNGLFYSKTVEEAWEFLVDLAEKTQQWSPQEFDRTGTSPAQQATPGGMYTLKPDDALNAKLETLISQKMKAMELKSVSETSVELACAVCRHVGHDTERCPTLPALQEMLHNPLEANWVGNNRGTNENWRQNPNLSWGNQQQVQPYRPPNYSGPPEKREAPTDNQAMLQHILQQNSLMQTLQQQMVQMQHDQKAQNENF